MSRVPSLVEKENTRLHLALEMIFREVVFNMLACSSDEGFTVRWMQNKVESIYCNKVDADEEDALQQERNDD